DEKPGGVYPGPRRDPCGSRGVRVDTGPVAILAIAQPAASRASTAIENPTARSCVFINDRAISFSCPSTGPSRGVVSGPAARCSVIYGGHSGARRFNTLGRLGYHKRTHEAQRSAQTGRIRGHNSGV